MKNPFQFALLLSLVLVLLHPATFAQDTERKITFPLPGFSLGSVTLQKDTLIRVLMTSNIADPSCKPQSLDDFYVIDTEVAKLPEQAGISPWQEIWTVSLCGKPIRFPIVFKPDPNPRTGTTIIVLPAKFAQKTERKITFPLPGSSLGSIALQKDTLIQLLMTANRADPSCKPQSWNDLYVIDTEVAKLPAQFGMSPGQEIWTVSLCGKPVRFPILFKSDPDPQTGTSILILIPKSAK